MSNLTFIIDNQIVETSDNTEFTRVYRGADNLDAKKNNYSLTVKFPFTYNNEKIFLRTNSLSYRSAFPYQTHVCNVLKDGVTLISNGKLVLLSTTSGFECSITWDDFDIIGALLNNSTKLGELLINFPLVNWNYNTDYFNYTYSLFKAETYGYFLYKDISGTYPTSELYLRSAPHPLINFKYLLSEVFSALGITVNIPTAKESFLLDLLIRPNKELDCNKSNIFTTHVQTTSASEIPFLFCCLLTYTEDLTTAHNAVGLNSYYFKTWIDTPDGEDDLFLILGTSLGLPVGLPQQYRFKSFADTTGNVCTITNFTAAPGEFVGFLKYTKSTDTWATLTNITSNGSFTFDANVGDWFVFYRTDPDYNVEFDFKIETTINSNLTETNPAYFPAMYHIPSNIDLTVGQLIREALKLTGSELIYNINDGSFSFSPLKKVLSTAYDITKHIVNIKEIKYDKKYIYDKLAQNNYFKYLNNSPVDGDYNHTVADTNLIVDKYFVESLFSPSSIQSGGFYNNTPIAVEHSHPDLTTFLQFTEQPLHLLFNDEANSRVVFTSDLEMSNIFNLWYLDLFNDLEQIIFNATIRTVKLNAEIGEVEFKRINTKGLVYISTVGKYYSIVEIIKQGDECEFFLLELF